MSDDLIYLSSPYSHPDPAVVEGRYRAVCAAAARFMREGHLIFSPIAQTHPIAMAGKLPTHWDFWQKYDHAHLRACGTMWILDLPGWELSKGIAGETEYMGILGNPIIHVAATAEELAMIPAPTCKPALHVAPAPPQLVEGFDVLYDRAMDVCLAEGVGTISLLQRKLGVGYSHADTLICELMRRGVLGKRVTGTNQHPLQMEGGGK